MPSDVHPLDHLAGPLIDVYAAQTRRLEQIVQQGLARSLNPDGTRPGAATLAYRQRQLEQARAQLAALTDTTRQAVPVIVNRAYGAGLITTDRQLAQLDQARTGVTGTFGRIHVDQTQALAGQMEAGLTGAAAQVGQRIESVFAAAAAIDGALDGRGLVNDVPFLGRRFNDQLRQVALEAVTGGTVALDTRRQVSAELGRRLVREGIASATAGIIDRRGRRWPLDTYVRMVARTTTREAASAATINRLGEHGLDLVTISSHPHLSDECSPYDGQTFSLSGQHPTYPRLDRRPPFHPNCRHVVTPAGANLDEFEAQLTENAGGTVTPPTPPPAPPPVVPPKPKIDLNDSDTFEQLLSEVRRVSPDTTGVQARRIEGHLRNGIRDELSKADQDLLSAIESSPHFAEKIAKIKELRAAEAAKDAALAALPKPDELIQAGADIAAKARAAGGAEREALERQLEDAHRLLADLGERQGGVPGGVDAYIEHIRNEVALQKRVTDANQQLAALDRQNLVQALKEARPGFGEGRVTNFTEKTTAASRQRIDEATKYLPREWVEKSNGTTLGIDIKPKIRAHYSGRPGKGGTIRLAPTDSDSTVLHELVHRMQDHVTGLDHVEATFYKKRVTRANGKLARRNRINHEPNVGGRASEMFRGAWSHPYIGKDYVEKIKGGSLYTDTNGRVFGKDKDGNLPVDPAELSTMAAEGLFYGRHSITMKNSTTEQRLQQYRRRRRDLEMREKLRPTEKEELERILATEQLVEHGDPDLAHFFIGILAKL